MSKTITVNQREIIAAQSTITSSPEYLSSTNHALNVNASISITGSPIPASGLTTALAVQIVDGSGNQITSFGGTQYIDGGTPPTHPVGPTLNWSDGTNWHTVSTLEPLPVNASVTITGVATSANQTNASQKTQLVDGSGNVIASTSNALNVDITNTSLAVTNAGTFAVQNTAATPAGTNLIGKVGIDQTTPGTTNAVAIEQNNGVASTNWTWVTATTLNTTQSIISNTFGYSTFILQFNPNASVTGGAITVEGSIDGTNFNPLNVQQINGETGLYPFNGTQLTLPASTPIIFQVAVGGVNYVRVRLSTAITGSGASVGFFANLSTSANFGATSEQGVSLIAPQSGQAANINSGGALYTSVILSGTSAPLDDTTNFGDGLSSGIAAVGGRLWNGTNYDRQYGDATNGAWANVKALPAQPTTEVNGQTTGTTAGTAVQLASHSLINGVIVQALSTNTTSIYIGTSSVSSSNGFELQPGQATSVAVSDTDAVWIVSSTNGDKVCWIGS